MGCDIHCFIEYRNPKDNSWRDFAGHINPGRNYRVFNRLCGGVRGDESEALFQSKGCPEDLGYSAQNSNHLYITKEEIAGEGSVSPDKAAQWVKEGSSKYVNNKEGKPTWVTNPDYHSHSWLTCEEWGRAILFDRLEGQYPMPNYKAIWAAMKSLEEDGYQTRVVFWFDN